MTGVTYTELARVGSYPIVQHSQSKQLFVAWYNAATRQVVRGSLATGNLADAVIKVQSLVDQGMQGDPRPYLKAAGPMTLRMILEAHRPYIAKLASAEAEAIHIAQFLNSDLADKKVVTIVPKDWEGLRDRWLAEGKTIGTISRRISTARSALRRAHDNGEITSFRKVPEFRTKNHMRSAKPKGAILSIAELARLYDAFEEPHLQIWYAFLLGTAARTAAILDLQLGSFERDPALVMLNPEGRPQSTKWRPCLPIHQHLAPWVEQLPPGRAVTWRGRPVKSVKKGRAAAVTRAGLDPRANSYSVRHSLGRFMQRKRVDREQIAIWLGHIAPPESPETTLIYSPYEPEFLIDAKRATAEFVAEIAARAKTPLLEPPPAVTMMWQLRRQRTKRDD